MDNSTKKLIYGKSDLERIVSIEVDEDKLHVFREGLDTLTFENKFWILANKPLTKRFVKLAGDLHYKYGWQSQDRYEFQKARLAWKQSDVYSIFDPKEAIMVKDGYTYFKGMKHSEVSVLSFDIETTGLFHDDTAKLLIVSNTFRSASGIIERKLFCYDEYKSEAELIDAWCAWVRDRNPSLLVGHNVYDYDLPYLNFIATRSKTSLLLGRDSSAVKFNSTTSRFRKDQTQFIEYYRPHVYGREVVDTLFLSIKYDIATKKYESYALKKIIAHEGLEVKDRQFYDADKIRYNYTNPVEWPKIKQYALHDADDALALFDLMVPPLFYSTQMTPKSMQSMVESATGSQINSILVRSYLQTGHSIPKASDKRKYEGAISFGKPGVYRNVMKIDIKSEYPSAILQHKIYDKEKDPKGHLLMLVETLAQNRFEFKRLAKETGEATYNDMDASAKLTLNSIYGSLGAAGLNFNSMECAEKVTAAGREVIKFSIEWATSKPYLPEDYGIEQDEEETDADDL